MPERSETHYFGAGPAPLPTSVLESAGQALLNYRDLGYGIAEMSHRSTQANDVLSDAKAALAELLDIPVDEYEVLFLQGGGSGEFSAVVYFLVGVWVERRRVEILKELEGQGKGEGEGEVFERLRAVVEKELKLDYLVTGSWSLKASQEAARLMGKRFVNVAVDAREHNEGKFGMIPEESSWKLSEGAAPALTYFCDNETVDGVEFPTFPKSLEADDKMVVADMSSNFLSRKVDVKKYSVIFGGAQKNIGVAGVTIVIVKKSLLPPQSQTASADLLRRLGLSVGPVVFDYATIAKNNSLYNTLPIFDVWIAGQVMQGLLKKFGSKKIAGQEEVANQKASMIYETLERYSEIYRVVPSKAARSRMNICLRIKKGDTAAEKEFIAGAEKLHLYGLKGHRSVGGIRCSNYNAVTLEGVEELVQYLNDFAQRQQTTNGA